MRLGAIVITYNIYPEALFASVAKTTHDIVWYIHHHHDNNQELESELKKFSATCNVDLRLHRTNRGLSKSWNDGLGSSIDDGNDFALLLNDDLFFYEGAFDLFVGFLEKNPHFGIAIAHGFEPAAGIVRQQGAACCAIGEPALRSIGFFDENIGPAYCEDTDYWKRAVMAGVPIIEDTRTLVEHDRSQTYRSASAESRSRIARAHEANRAYFIRKWGGMWNGKAEDVKFRNPFDDARFGLTIERAHRAAPYGYPYDRADWQFSENMAHVQNQGDIWFPQGEWCGKPGSGLWIEGLMLASPAGLPADDLEYSAILGDEAFSDWFRCGEYLGSRDKMAPLRGFRIRLTGDSVRTHALSCTAGFVDGSVVESIGEPEIVCAAAGNPPLEAICLEVKEVGRSGDRKDVAPGRAADTTTGESGMSELSLDEIGRKHGTDKSSAYHDYLRFYESFFAERRNHDLSILEIGVFNGQSLKTWDEYFPNAKIVGVDITPSAKRFEDGRIAIEIADQSNIEHLTSVALKHGPFDLIVEDGSHMCEHQITSLRTLFPFVRDGGIYIVEDLQTNYGQMLNNYLGVSSITCVDYLKKWLDLRVGDDQIDISQVEDAFLRTYGRAIEYMSFYRRACLIKKNLPHANPRLDAPIVDDKIHALSKSVRVLAHFALAGDVPTSNGCANGDMGKKQREIQGLSLASIVGVLQYRAMGLDGVWTNWVDEKEFVGTRGKSRPLGGLAVRIREPEDGSFTVRTICRFVGDETPVVAFDGKDCRSGKNASICAIQIDLTPK